MHSLGSIGCFALGSATTLYGLYSYHHSKLSNGSEQKKKAMWILAAGVALIAIGAGLYFTSPEINLEENLKIPESLDPYVKQLEGRAAKQFSSGVIPRFPSYLSRFPFTGKVATEEGWLCHIPTKLPPLIECEQVVEATIHRTLKEAPEHYHKAMTLPESVWGKGYIVNLSNDVSAFLKVSFGMNPIYVTNYQKALKEAEKIFLKDLNFLKSPENVIVNSIKKVHECLFTNLAGGSPGQFRKGYSIVYDRGIWPSAELTALLGRLGQTESDIKNLDLAFIKEKQYGGFQAAWKFLTPDEFKAFREIIFIPISVEKIEAAFSQFASQFKTLCSLVKERLVNPIAAGAWVHQQMVEIHPFEDGNGRIARILMNVILQLGGIKGVVIPDDLSYTIATLEDQKIPGTFVKFLISVLDWNNQQKVLAP